MPRLQATRGAKSQARATRPPVRPDRSLAARFPKVAALWHPTKNRPLRPADVSARVALHNVWWRCLRDPSHEWRTSVSAQRQRGQRCPICAKWSKSLAHKFPAIAREWDRTKNDPIKPEAISPGSDKIVWWRCARDERHQWATAAVHRTRDRTGCPYCAGQRATPSTSLARRNRRLAREWHAARNAPLGAGDVVPGSSRKVWWRCSAVPRHVWQAVVRDRSRGTGCPYCWRMTRRRRPRPSSR